MSSRVPLPALEYHLAHGCNLSCQQCSHYSDFRLPGAMPAPSEAEAEYRAWNQRILPKRFALLGGEPLLNPNLIEHLHLARECWPHSDLMLVTNGFFLDRHPDLPKALVEIDCRLEVSQHGTHEAYLSKFRKAERTLWRWREEYPGIQIKIRQSHRGWMRQYRIDDGKPKPFDSMPNAAYKICMQKTCTQLFKQRLWKCPALAYWSQLEQRLNLEDTPSGNCFGTTKLALPNAAMPNSRPS